MARSQEQILQPEETPFPEDLVLGPVRRRLTELSKLQRDWDSYDGSPPSLASVSGALSLSRSVGHRYWRVFGDRVQPTAVSPLPTGGIELEWRNASDLLAVEIAPDGRYGYLRKRGSGGQVRYEEGDGLTQDEVLPLLAEVLSPRS